MPSEVLQLSTVKYFCEAYPKTTIPGQRQAWINGHIRSCFRHSVDQKMISTLEAIFTAPPHESWSGAALLDLSGRLCGVGSLVISGFEVNETRRTVNMFVPIGLLTPVIDEICERGRRATPPRPWS